MSNEQKENKMGVMPVRQLIVTMALPMMVSMLVQALYNIVDSIFVSYIGEDALTAVTLAYPIQNLMIAFGSGTGVGMNALLSRSLGEKNQKRADAAANNTMVIMLINMAIFILFGLFGAEPFIRSQTDDAQIIAYGSVYLHYICILSVGLFCQMYFERLLQATGRTLLSMYSQITGAVINIILDPMLIFGIGIFPELGVEGAAIATVFGQTAASCLGLFMNKKYNSDVHISLRGMAHPSGKIIGKIYYVGIPSTLMIAVGSLMTYLMNGILMAFSSTATAVFGVYFKLQSFVFMPVIGLNNGIVPVLAYNYGAQKKDRIYEALRFSIRLAFCIMLCGTILFETIPGPLLSIFNASDEMLAIGIPALRIIAIHFPIAGICIVMGSIFQAFSRSMNSLIVSVCRQLVVLIPAAALLARTGVLMNVWWAFPIAEVVSLTISTILFRRLMREVVDPM